MDGPKLMGVGLGIKRAADGTFLSSFVAFNEIKTVGKAEVAQLIGSGLGGTAFGYLANGSSSTANSPAQTTLVAENTLNGFARAAATVTNVTTTTTNDTARFTKSWTSTGGTTVIEEVGILNAAAAGDLLGRLLTGTKTFTTGEIFTMQYDIIVS